MYECVCVWGGGYTASFGVDLGVRRSGPLRELYNAHTPKKKKKKKKKQLRVTAAQTIIGK